MLDARARPLKDRLLGPLAASLGTVNPGYITVASLAPGLGAAWLAWRGAFAAALGCWLLNRLLDGLDGLVARRQQRQTDFGGYIDLLADFVVYAAIPIALALGSPDPGARGPALWLLASFYVNALSWLYLAAIIERRGAAAGATSIVMPTGVVGGTETMIFYTLFLLLPGHLAVLFTLMAILVAGGVLQRIVWARRHL